MKKAAAPRVRPWSARGLEGRGYHKCPYCWRHLVGIDVHVAAHRSGKIGPDGRRTDRSPEDRRAWAAARRSPLAARSIAESEAPYRGSEIPQRELRNDVAGVLARVQAGERLVVTVSGRPVAELVPYRGRRRFVPGAEVYAMLSRFPPDPHLLEEVDAAVAPEGDE